MMILWMAVSAALGRDKRRRWSTHKERKTLRYSLEHSGYAMNGFFCCFGSCARSREGTHQEANHSQVQCFCRSASSEHPWNYIYEQQHRTTSSIHEMFRYTATVPEFTIVALKSCAGPVSAPTERVACSEDDNRPLLRLSYIPWNHYAE